MIFLMREHMRAGRTIFQTCLTFFVQKYMKRTYFLIGMNKFMLLLDCGSFVLTFYFDS